MKRIIFVIIIVLLVVPLFADIDPVNGWRIGDTDNAYSFIVKFNGAEYYDFGFSKTMTTYSKGTGLAKNGFDNNSVTLTQTGHDASSYSYKTSDTYYIYWYLSLTQQVYLDLTVTSSEPDDNTITVSVDTYTYSCMTTADTVTYEKVDDRQGDYKKKNNGSYKYVGDNNGNYKRVTVKGTTSLSGTKGDNSATVTSSDSSATTVASFPACYAVVQGNSAFTATAVVKKYPDSRRIGTLKLTLRTA